AGYFFANSTASAVACMSSAAAVYVAALKNIHGIFGTRNTAGFFTGTGSSANFWACVSIPVPIAKNIRRAILRRAFIAHSEDRFFRSRQREGLTGECRGRREVLLWGRLEGQVQLGGHSGIGREFTWRLPELPAIQESSEERSGKSRLKVKPFP